MLGTGDNFHWSGVGHSTSAGSTFFLGTRGSFAVVPPLRSLKAMCFRCWSTHYPCAPTLAVISLKLSLIISPCNMILIASGCITTMASPLPVGPLAIVIRALVAISQSLVGSLLGVSACLLSPFNNGH